MFRVKAALLIAFFSVTSFTACATDGETVALPESATPVAPTEAATATEVQSVTGGEIEAAAGIETTTYYYSDPAKTNLVGWCIQRTCPPKGRTCSGITNTPYREIEQSDCF